MLKTEIYSRLSMEEVLHHPWLEWNFEIMIKLCFFCIYIDRFFLSKWKYSTEVCVLYDRVLVQNLALEHLDQPLCHFCPAGNRNEAIKDRAMFMERPFFDLPR
jgi:hypothetical protein